MTFFENASSPTLPSWVGHFFDRTYALTDLKWPVSRQDSIASGIARLLHLKGCGSVLDQCAGTGGLSLGLARRGLEVHAVEQSSSYVSMGQSLAREYGLSVHWAVGDAGAFRPLKPLDAAVNWHSSLGYGGYSGACLLLTALFESVRPGGRVLLELSHRPHLDRIFKQDWLTFRSDSPWGPVNVRRLGRWEDDTLFQYWQYEKEGHLLSRSKETCCWHPPVKTLSSLVVSLGFCVVDIRASVESDVPLTEESPRVVLTLSRM